MVEPEYIWYTLVDTDYNTTLALLLEAINLPRADIEEPEPKADEK